MFGNLASSLTKIVQTLNIPGVMSQALGGLLSTPDPRRQFIAVLLATAAHVEAKPNFNIELEINDLWVRLGNLRQAQPTGNVLSQAFQMNADLLNKLSQSLNSMSINATKNMR